MSRTAASRQDFLRARSAVLMRLFLILAAISAIMAVVRYLHGDTAQAINNTFLFLTISGAYTLLKKSVRYYYTVARLTFLTVFVSTMFTVIHNDSPIRYIWLTTTVYFTYFVFSQKEGQRWLMAFAAVLLYMGLFHFELFRISHIEFILWLVDVFFVILISKWYLELEQDSIRRLQTAEYELRKEVEAKTAELRRKTEELERLNATLEEQIAQKIEENRRQEEQLARQARYAQMGEMLNMIAHQWRQPLNAISITTYTVQKNMQERKCDPQKVSDYLRRIGEYTQHLSQTIEDFRNFFKFEKEKKPTPLHQIVKDAYKIMEPIFLRYSIRFEYNCPESMILHTYPNEVLHALLNILRNAQEALVQQQVPNPYIRIRGLQETHFACIVIEDNAGGIPDEIQSRIFDPYFTTKDRDGSGLGLYMTKTLIERHCNGKLSFEVTQEGTRFFIRLPLDKGNLPALLS